jgi:hypothetical protein
MKIKKSSFFALPSVSSVKNISDINLYILFENF